MRRASCSKSFWRGGPSVSCDEINQVAAHAYYRNSPANDNSKFSIENPHLFAFWLVHLEELVYCLHAKTGKEDEDSMAGLARFFIAHFRAVTSKLLPAGTADGEADELVESDEYFNKLTFDQIASASVHILLLLSRLFIRYVKRSDEEDHPERYSKLLGLHALAFNQPLGRSTSPTSASPP